MGTRKDIKSKFALISVYEKKNLGYLCNNLTKYNYKFISTDSTYLEIINLGFKCLNISKLTKSKEMFDGRVKTLSTEIYSSLLYKRDNTDHVKEFKKIKMPNIDLVIINFYPFKKYIKNSDQSNIIEMIDIGGPSLVRAASKNYKYITTISNHNEYKNLINNLKRNNGNTDLTFRKKMASKSFEVIKKYDESISNWFNNKRKPSNKILLKYGENANQKSFITSNKNYLENIQLNGKQLSYNNIIDIDSGFKCIQEFKEPTCVIVKHTNPCGVSSSENIESAFNKAFASDMKSAFGGIVLLNRNVNLSLAKKLKKVFFNIIVASGFDRKSLEILKDKENLVLIKLKKINNKKHEFRSTIFGTLYQEINNDIIDKKFLKLVSKSKCSKKDLEDLIFSIKVAKHVKSNAIVLSSNKQTLGIGAGETNRIDALNVALKKLRSNFKIKNFVCVSDGFFPFIDSIRVLKNNNCSAVVQPYGSINDIKNIEFANKYKLPLYFTKNRFFKH